MPKIQSFDDLLSRAKVAQQAMRELNLSLIEAHDRNELRKLDDAIDVLSRLNQDAETPRQEEHADGAPRQTLAAATPASVAKAASPGATPDPLAAAAPAASSPAHSSTSQDSTQMPREIGGTTRLAAPDQAARAAAPGAPPRSTADPDDPALAGAQRRPATAAGPTRAAPAATGAATTRAAAPKPVVTPTTAPGTFAEQISKGTYTRRLRRVFVTGAGQGMVPLLDVPHRHGLPGFDNCLAPDDSPVDGAFGIFVSQSAVFAAALRRPFADNEWQVIETIHCRQQRDIVDAVADLMRRPTFTIQVPLV